MSKKLIVLCLSLMSTSLISAKTLSQIYVFGDSLQDNGNFYNKTIQDKTPPAPNNTNYYNGRYSNEPIAAEYLTKYFVSSGTSTKCANYAFGGSLVNIDNPLSSIPVPVSQQIKHVTFNSDADNSLTIMDGGANNYLFGIIAIVQKANQNWKKGQYIKMLNDIMLDLDMYIVKMPKDIANNIDDLVNKGQRNIIVWNLPDLTKTPLFQEELPASLAKTIIPVIKSAVDKSNEEIATVIQKANQHYASMGVKIQLLDAHTILDQVIDAKLYSNSTNSCVKSAGSADIVAMKCGDFSSTESNKHLFWDLAHPTTSAHEIISKDMALIANNMGFDLDLKQLDDDNDPSVIGQQNFCPASY